MSEELKNLIDAKLPDNNTKSIKPVDVRDTLEAIVDELDDKTYNFSDIEGTVADAQLSEVYSNASLKTNSINTVFSVPGASSPSIAARSVINLSEFRSSVSNTVGAIIFTAPSDLRDISFLLDIDVFIHHESASKPVKLILQGAINSSNVFSGISKLCIGGQDIQARYGLRADGKLCIILGAVDTSWNQPHVRIASAMFSNNVSDNFCKNWTTEIVTSLFGFTNITANLNNTIENFSTSEKNTLASIGDLAFKDEITAEDIDASGTPSSSTYLRGDMSWSSLATVATSNSYNDLDNKPTIGNVFGPSSSLNNNIAAFDDTTGKLIKDSGIPGSAVVPKPTATSSAIDLNTIVTPGWYDTLVYGTSPNGWGSADYGYLLVLEYTSSITQLVFPYYGGKMRYRDRFEGTWSPWKTVAVHGDYLEKTQNLNDLPDKGAARASLNVDILSGFRNKVINGNFDVWQRGIEQTNYGYGSDDRWRNVFITNGTMTHTRQLFALGQTAVPGNPVSYSRTVVHSYTQTSDSAVLKEQHFESVRTLAGKQATLTFYAKADSNKSMSFNFYQMFGNGGSPSPIVEDIDVTKVALTTSWQKFSFVVNIPSINGKTLGTNGNDHLGLQFFSRREVILIILPTAWATRPARSTLLACLWSRVMPPRSTIRSHQGTSSKNLPCARGTSEYKIFVAY